MKWLRTRVKWSMVSTAFFSVMTLLAVAPYDLGSIATAYPPWLKPWIFGIGVPLTAMSRLFAAKKPVPPPPAGPAPAPLPPEAAMNFYTINISRSFQEQPVTSAHGDTKKEEA